MITFTPNKHFSASGSLRFGEREEKTFKFDTVDKRSNWDNMREPFTSEFHNSSRNDRRPNMDIRALQVISTSFKRRHPQISLKETFQPPVLDVDFYMAESRVRFNKLATFPTEVVISGEGDAFVQAKNDFTQEMDRVGVQLKPD